MGISPSESVRDITRSEYIGKDFNTYRQELIDAIEQVFGTEVMNNIVASEQGIMLIEVVAHGLSTLSFYGDRQADEVSFEIPGGARIRSNVVAIARILGYSPFAAVPPVIEVTMTIDPPFDAGGGGLPARLTLEKGRKLNGPNGLVYELAEEVVFEAGEAGPKTFIAREGVSFNAIFVSTGEANQRFFLANFPEDKSIAEATVDVRVGGVLWETVDLMRLEQADIVEQNLGAETPFIRFGDGVAGNIPPKDVEVRVSAFATAGPAGSVASNTVTQFTTPLIAGTTDVTATLTHDEPSTPGSFRETINSIKTNAPLVHQTADRAVTTNDLDGLINSFVDPTWGAVAIGRATTPRSAEEDAQIQSHLSQLRALSVDDGIINTIETYWNKVLSSNCQANVVLAQILSEDVDGRYVSSPVGLARALESYLDGLVESTVKVRAIDGSVNVVSVDASIGVKVLAAFDTPVQSSNIKTQVSNIIEGYLLGRSYGANLNISDIYADIEAVDGVDYANIKYSSVTQNEEDASSKVDEFGNIVIGEFEVITMGEFPVVMILE